MRLSKRTEYGLRAVVHLARSWPASYVQSQDLANQESLPNKFLEASLLTLRRGGFLESKVGAGGGYKLARPPSEIRVGEVIRRLEGRLGPRDTSPMTEGSAGHVAVRLINDKLTDATDAVLDGMSLEQLIEHVSRATGGQHAMYYI